MKIEFLKLSISEMRLFHLLHLNYRKKYRLKIIYTIISLKKKKLL